MQLNASEDILQAIKDAIRFAATDEGLMKRRGELVRFVAETFLVAGSELHALGHIVATDRIDGTSPCGHGSDEAVGVSILFRIAAQLTSASADLFRDGRSYAAAALVRQIVEIEYLAWAMETKDREGERWLRSDRALRESFFTPAKLRKAAQRKFRGKDFGYHCEIGGHAVPAPSILLGGDNAMSQLLLVDLLGHVGRIWDHLVGWASASPHGGPILTRKQQMLEKVITWKSLDPLAEPAPPTQPIKGVHPPIKSINPKENIVAAINESKMRQEVG